MTETLFSLLDNAPTCAVVQAAESMAEAVGHHRATPGVLPPEGGAALHEDLLIAICRGVVFGGAMARIGNGPNLMIKSIAERPGIRMPGCCGCMLYSMPILIPVFVLVTLLFVR